MHAHKGDTPCKGLAQQHCDLKCLDSTRLVQVAGLIADAMKRKDGAIYRASKTQVEGMIKSARERGLIRPEEMSPELQKAVESL